MALQILAALPVKGRAPKTGYTREAFGQAWSDDVTVADGHNGCDTRNDILRRDLTATQIKPGTQGCVVLAGTLADPYSAQSIPFVSGPDSADVQIDHLVALSDAWQSGAQQLTADRRQDFANDPLNLLAVSGPINGAKGDGDAATWLPPNVGYRCAYVTAQIQVKARYDLWVKPAERDAMAGILTNCGGVPAALPPVVESPDTTAGSPQDAPEPPSAAPAPAAPAPTPAAPTAAPDGSISYKNCAAARAAGAAPLYRGQPGYTERMDGDHDGVACEN